LKISVDTNVLVRDAIGDDQDQGRVAAQALESAELVAISLSCLCEFFWVLRQVYRLGREEISDAIYALLETENVVMNRVAVEAGMAIFEAGGDFADGVIAYEGGLLGGETFVSFDKKAVSLIAKQGQKATLLS
jgi:predicted nucleic-acid-binding protein